MHRRPRLTRTSSTAGDSRRRSCLPVPRRRDPGARAALTWGAALVLTLSGCSAAVDVTPPAGAGSSACAAAARAWPQTVSGLKRRDTTSSSAAVAAWGDPPVIARCGMPVLAPTADPCLEVNGVGWVQTNLSDGTKFTTFGTDPAIEVLVPAAYAPEGLLLPVFTAAAKTLPTTGHVCR